jgi:hypothetical protein
MSTDPNLEAMHQTLNALDQVLDDAHDALTDVRRLRGLDPIRIVDGLPVLDELVAGHVHVIADASTTIVAVFDREAGDHWWNPLTWTEVYSHREHSPFGCGSISIYTAPGHPRVMRAEVRHRLLDSWKTAAEVLKQVLDHEQYLELRDILEQPTEATEWGPWKTAIETGA